MGWFLRISLFVVFIIALNAEDDFEFNSDEVMIAQESRQYQTIIKPPVIIVKPIGVTNSHRPQYNLDSLEHDVLEDIIEPTARSFVKNYKSSSKIRAKDEDAVLKALERKDHVRKFAQVLPIVRATTGSQRVALASLVGRQVGTPLGRTPMALAQAQLLRRSFTEDDGTPLEDELFDTGVETTTNKHRTRRIIPPRTLTKTNNTTLIDKSDNNRIDSTKQSVNNTDKTEVNRITTRNPISITTESISTSSSSLVVRKSVNTLSRSISDNSTSDHMADSTNQTLAQDLPVPEKLTVLNRYIDRKGALIRRGTYPPKTHKPSLVPRRTTVDPALPTMRRRPVPAKKLPSSSPSEPTKCELFTNTLCLHSEDYPIDEIVQSIRHNKAAAGALLADFKDPGEGALDGVTAAQEAKYTADHYLMSNRRGDIANRDFASAGEAGFMCPSTVKYARPQRARATSGQWKYIVNTGEHTQTLRLEKCLKPKDSCTYLTDNFKSKCVQVYNYHRLLTWDQQNGLHMDIFKVPTCCSCHIEGYSVSFPPLGHRIHETSSEHFPGQDLSEQDNNAFEAVQSSVPRPNINSPPFTHKKPLESIPPFSDNQNLIAGQTFSKINDVDETNLPPSNSMNSYGNTYFPDSFNQASSIKNIRRPPSDRNPVVNNFDSVTLPSFLEPPTPAATSSFSFVNESPSSSKYKITGNNFKRGAVRPSRRPIRKKISGEPDDLSSSGTSAIESFTNSNIEPTEDFGDYLKEPGIGQASMTKTRVTIAPKLHAVTTEKISTTLNTQSSSTINENLMSSGKRVNYNYHPIIDFFGDGAKDDDESIDRGDSKVSYVVPSESEWKPINHRIKPSRQI